MKCSSIRPGAIDELMVLVVSQMRFGTRMGRPGWVRKGARISLGSWFARLLIVWAEAPQAFRPATGSRRAGRGENHDRKGTVGLALEISPDRENRIQFGPQHLALLVRRVTGNRAHLATIELHQHFGFARMLRYQAGLLVVTGQRPDNDHVFAVLQKDQWRGALFTRLASDTGQQESRESRWPFPVERPSGLAR